MRKRTVAWLLLLQLPAVLYLSGCATARVNHFRGFAQAGTAYTRAADVVLEEAGNAAIAADSMVLEKTREQLSKKERADLVLEHNQLMRERLQLLADLQRHGLLLRSYFEALAALSESDAPSAIGQSIEGLVESLGKIHPEIETAKVGDQAVSSFVGRVTQPVVASFRLRALERELRANAPTIERELDLQQAALAVVTEGMETDLKARLLQDESKEVVLPYAGEGSLPSNWSRRRQEILRANVTVASAKAAADAAKSLQTKFVFLVEGRFTAADLSLLISDIDKIVSLIEDIRGIPGTKSPT